MHPRTSRALRQQNGTSQTYLLKGDPTLREGGGSWALLIGQMAQPEEVGRWISGALGFSSRTDYRDLTPSGGSPRHDMPCYATHLDGKGKASCRSFCVWLCPLVLPLLFLCCRQRQRISRLGLASGWLASCLGGV